MSARRIPLATMVAAGLLAGGVAAAGWLTATGALAAGSAPHPTASATPGAPGYRQHPGFGARGGLGMPGFGAAEKMLHGEVVVAKQGGGTETLLVQYGTISAKSTGSVTVRSSDGFTQVWSLGSGTTYRTGVRSGSAADLAVGDTVGVVGTKAGSGGSARTIMKRPKGTANGKTGPGNSGSGSSSSSGSGSNGQGSGTNGNGGPGWRHGGPGMPGMPGSGGPGVAGSSPTA
jgi:hypothetical protein